MMANRCFIFWDDRRIGVNLVRLQAKRVGRRRLWGPGECAMVLRSRKETQMTTGNEYESEIDALMRKLRADPKIEAQRQRYWAQWWQPDRSRRRDAASVTGDPGLAPHERDMAYAARRADVQGGAG